MRLLLFVSDASRVATRAEAGLHALTELAAANEVQLEVVDVLARPDVAAEHHVLATPTLVKVSPEPQQRIVGNMSDLHGLSEALGLELLPGRQNGETAPPPSLG